MRRTSSFDEMLSKRLQDPDYAREYIIASMEGEDGETLIGALLGMIEVMGIKEYSELVNMPKSAISRLLSVGDIPKIETLNKLLAPFKLKAKLNVEKVA